VPLNLPVAVIISREIKPFIEMVEGFESALDQPVVRIFIDQDSKPFSHDPLYKGPQIEHYSFVIAVGPSALSYLVKNNNLVDDKRSTSFDTNLLTANARVKSNGIAFTAVRKILYAMVLNPETIIPEGVSLCGVSLNIFSEDTVLKITKVFPSVRKMGVLFDPANNSEWFAAAIKNGVFSGITTVPMHIMEESDVNRLNQQDVSNVDALLFIPDKTVTSPTIISHIIKQSIARKIPVIGYNSFFHKSGAALSFILDYRKIGGQMAYKVLALSQGEFSESKGALAHGKSCEPSTPAYYMTLNRSVVELLDIELGSTLPSELKVEP
jgi:putative ABC transport system substrate-binding protein